MFSTLFILGGLHSLSQVAHGSLARGLSRMGMIIALPGAGSMLTGPAIDGYAMKMLADLWANALGADKADAFHAAMSMEQVQLALFYTWAAFFVGAPFLLLGLSGLAAGAASRAGSARSPHSAVRAHSSRPRRASWARPSPAYRSSWPRPS